MSVVSAGATFGAVIAGFFACCVLTICARLLLRFLASRREAAAHRRRLRQIDNVFDDTAAGPSVFSDSHDEEVELSAAELQQLHSLGAELGGDSREVDGSGRGRSNSSNMLAIAMGAPVGGAGRRPVDAVAPQSRAAALVAASKKSSNVR